MSETERIIKTTIHSENAGQRLDLFLSGRFDYLSRNQWQKLIKAGSIVVNDRTVRCSRLLNENDIVTYKAIYQEPAVNMEYSIAYEDEYLFVINKSGNLPCHPAGPFFKNTLWYDMEQRYGKIYLASRLDRETSGLLLIAKNPETAAKLSAMNIANKIKKHYLTVIHGSFAEKNFLAKGFLFPDNESEVRKKRAFSQKQPKKNCVFETAETQFYKLTENNNFSLLEAVLKPDACIKYGQRFVH